MARGPTFPEGGVGEVDEGGPIACPGGMHMEGNTCVPNDAPPGGGPGNCPQGQVWHAWPPPGRCEAPDALSKADRDTCNEADHPQEPHPDCYWCEFDTQQWRRGMCSADAPGAGGGGARGAAAAAPARGGSPGAGGGFPNSPYELALAAIQGQLAGTLQKFAQDVYGVGFPAYQQGVDYYQTLLGKGGRGRMQAVTAPAAEQIQEGTEGASRALGSGYLRGGAREQAETALRVGSAGDVAHLTQGVQPGAADRLIQAGGAGIGQAGEFVGGAAGVYGNLANLAVSSRLTSSGQDLQRELGLKGMQLQRDLGFAGLDLQYSQLAAQMKQFESSFGLQSALGFGGLQLSYDQLAQQGTQFGQQLASNEKIARQQQSQQTGMGLGSIFGSLGAAAITKSAAAYKEGITDPIPQEEALRRIVEEAAPALRGWKYKGAAQVFDNAIVLDLAPRYGVGVDAEHPGGRIVNLHQLLGDLVGAVAALQAEVVELRGRLGEGR